MHTRNGRRGWLGSRSRCCRSERRRRGAYRDPPGHRKDGHQERRRADRHSRRAAARRSPSGGHPSHGAPPRYMVTWSTARRQPARPRRAATTDADGVSSSDLDPRYRRPAPRRPRPGRQRDRLAPSPSPRPPKSTGAPRRRGRPFRCWRMAGNRFSPTNITVQVGTTVTWVWGTNATRPQLVRT